MKKQYHKNEELFLKAQNGDKEAEEELLVSNDRLVYHIAQKYSSTGYEISDLVSAGRIGFMKGYQTFKPDKGNKFATYVSMCIDNQIKMQLRSLKKHKGVSSIHHIMHKDNEGNDLTLEELLPTPESEWNIEHYETAKQVLKIFNENAKENEKQILQLRIIDGLTQQEAGKIMGISQSYVARKTGAVKKTLQHIRETGKFKRFGANDNSGEGLHKNYMEELEMGKHGLKKADMKYIFENYSSLTPKEIAELTGYKKQSVINYRAHFKSGKWDNIISTIKPELKEKIDKYIVKNKTEKVKKPSTISDATIEAAKQVQLDRIKKIEEEKTSTWIKKEVPIKEIAKEEAEKTLKNIKKAIDVKGPTETAKVAVESYKKEKEKNIIIKNQVALMSNDKDEISDLIYGIYQMIKNSPKGEVKLEISYEVSV